MDHVSNCASALRDGETRLRARAVFSLVATRMIDCDRALFEINPKTCGA
jgi:hypothetical protein